jgi:hypothetical protein
MSRTSTALLLTSLILIILPASAQRRRTMRSPGPAVNLAYTEGGYADRASVTQGSPIRLHIATSVSPFAVKVVNLARPTSTLMTINNLTSASQNCTDHAGSGCGWPVTTTLDVPVAWNSGYYAATFPTSQGERNIVFVVKSATHGTRSPIVVVSSTHTWQAYNKYGGSSLDTPDATSHLSFDRPYDANAGLGRYPIWEKFFVDWMTKEDRRFEVLTDADLEEPTALSGYDVVVLVGHSEYWTAAARTRIEDFSHNGGHIAIFGGNSMWWQVRLENDGRTLVGYKSAAQYDPAQGGSDALVTTNWYADPVNMPENRIFGASFRNGGWANKVDTPNVYQMKPLLDRQPWTVADASSWVFNSTNLHNGDAFGRDIAGLEVDGVLFNCDTLGRIIGAEGSDEAPLNYHILATTPASYGWGTMGYAVTSSGGAVFNAATQGWVWGLEFNEDVQQMTRNVLDRFRSGAPLPYDPVSSNVVASDSFNCTQPTLANPGWKSDGSRGTTSLACAYEGPGGLELSGSQLIALSRNVAPAGQSRDHVDLRFYLRTDDFVQRTLNPLPLVTLRMRSGGMTHEVAHVEIDATNGQKQIRIARRAPDGTFSASAGWIPLPNGWHLVEATWRSPGELALQLDGGARITLNNPFAGQVVNEMVIEYPAPELTDAGRVCVDAVAAMK